MIQRIDLSDEAYNNLKAIARSAGYGRIAYFLVDCAKKNVEFYDARPDALRALTKPHEAPIWYDGSPGYTRTFGGLPTSYLVTIAHSHHIRSRARQAVSLRGLNPERRIRAMHKEDTPWQTTCAVLEAIGLGYLRPHGVLPHFIPVKKPKKPLDNVPIIM